MWQRYHLLHRIAQFVLSRHCGLPPQTIRFFGEHFDALLFPTGRAVSPVGTEVFEVWEELTRRMRLLSSRGSLPLNIKELTLVDPLARYTEPFPPLPHPLYNFFFCFVHSFTFVSLQTERTSFLHRAQSHTKSKELHVPHNTNEPHSLYIRPLQAFILVLTS